VSTKLAAHQTAIRMLEQEVFYLLKTEQKHFRKR